MNITHESIPAAARPVIAQFLAERTAERHHLVIALSGAHAYGFPSPDSDFDLKAAHIEPTASLVGLHPPSFTADKMEIRDGVELDYTSNELQMTLSGVLKGNGNYIERILGAILLETSAELASLQPLVERSLSRRLYHHYHGFATSQLREFEKGHAAKRALYVIRTALTGAHALATGRLVVDVTLLVDEYGFAGARELIEAKKRGEKTVLDEAARAHWIAEVQRAFSTLDAALARSVLPEEPPNVSEIGAWLIEVRRKHFE